MLDEYLEFVQSQKGKNIVVYDITGEKKLNDFVIVQHFANASDNKKFAESFMEKFNISAFPEGYNRGEWIVFDLDKVIIHSFIAVAREKYNLDKLWQNKKVDIKNQK